MVAVGRGSAHLATNPYRRRCRNCPPNLQRTGHVQGCVCLIDAVVKHVRKDMSIKTQQEAAMWPPRMLGYATGLSAYKTSVRQKGEQSVSISGAEKSKSSGNWRIYVHVFHAQCCPDAREQHTHDRCSPDA